jgi:FkbM family methyltransferase
MLKSLKKVYNQLQGKYVAIEKTVVANHAWYGSPYGGFFVCPDILNNKSIVYSFGIGEEMSFDLELIEKHNCTVVGFDPTPKSIQWIANQNLLENFTFYPYGIAGESGVVEFFLPKNSEHVSGSIIHTTNVNKLESIKVEMKSIQDILRQLKHQRIDVVKMDIEGAEYEVLPKILESEILIDQILVEFHHRMIPNGASLTKNAIESMRKHGYHVFAVSESLEEVSFIRR